VIFNAGQHTSRRARGADGRTRAGRRRHRLAAGALVAMLGGSVLATGGSIAAQQAPQQSVRPNVGIVPTQANQSEAFRFGFWTWGSSISYNPYNPDYIDTMNMATLGLAAFFDHNRPGSDIYYPELAQSWTLGAHSITLHLQPKAAWQDGTPFTSKDVLDSFLIAGGDFNAIWADITSISAPDAHTVVIDLQSWAVVSTVLLKVFQVRIVPASQYGHLIPSGMEQDLLTYWKIDNTLHPSVSSLAAATNSAAGKAISAVATALVKYNPPYLLGNGAYKLTSASVSGVLYEKWTGFWDAKAITAPWVEVYPMDLSTQFGSLETGRIDFQQDTQFTDTQATQLDSTSIGHYVFIPSAVQQETLVLHLGDYPLGMLPVRQALEDVINRPKLTQLDMGGSLIQDPPTSTPDGINDFEADQYIKPSQFATLNHYSYDPAKATSLLESVGFKKKNGTWYTPKGTVFSLTISEPSANAQFDTDGVIVADQLKAFGIDASSVIVNEATYTDQQYAGDYEISENFMDWQLGPPMADFAATFAQTALPAFNYPVTYSGKGSFNGSVSIGLNPIQNVPGLGTVNIAQTLNDEINTAPPSQWAGLTWDWIRWFNANLPMLPLYNNAFHEAYSTSRYTDFPPNSAKWLWTNLSYVGQPIVWMQNGYLKLK
jgi:peptide/nickel transport system substrate-binding protein